MALVFITEDNIGVGVRIDNTDVSNNDVLIIQEGVTVATESFGDTVSFTTVQRLTSFVHGDLYSGDDCWSMTMSDTTNAVVNLTIGATGSIFGTGNAIYSGGTLPAQAESGINSVMNAGTLTSTRETTVFLFWTETANFENSGSVVKHASAEVATFANAVNLYGVENATVTNSGSIISYSVTGNRDTYASVRFSNGTDNVTLSNTGTISGTNAAIVSDALVSESIENDGMIFGDVLLSNTIGGTMLNTGTISGDVNTRGGDDVVTNGGLITQSMLLGAGDDTYTAIDGGLALGGVFGAEGNDTITGGALADFIDGGDDNDRLFGRGGDDDMRGGLGSDFISAGDGDDLVIGDNGADRIFGGGGEDTLQGGRDLDTIRGGDGDDEINGGRSADILRGGSGADTFLYQFRQDSTLNLSDRIQDFEVGVDVIDVAATASQLSFIGSAAFSGSGNEVRYEIGGNGRTFVEVDTDANGVADMRILLGTVGALAEDDFVL